MDAAAHNSSFAKAAGVPVKVAKEFSETSKGLKFGKGSTSRADLQKINKPETRHGKSNLFKEGGMTMDKKQDMKMDKATVKKAVGMHDKQQHMGKKTDLTALKKGGKAMMPGYKDGGMPMVMKDGKKVPAFAADGEGKMKKGGVAKKMNMGGMGYAKGGGAETKGKTQGKNITMKRGGKC